ncbi:MAG: hypothetical protein M1817_002025 [Caeruleum heppii]|nr:MAG: hypothetical protein M1817_002025 [Caeruleum heppii]
MGRLPAVVIIARHGARLDAADSRWHLTSPTPYDTPLTYGGWTQSRALGARIASLLETRNGSAQDSPLSDGDKNFSSHASSSHLRNGISAEGSNANRRPSHGHQKRPNYRVVIHTSPYLRCVQTSIGISVGLAQHHGPLQPVKPTRPARPSHLHSASPRLNALDATASPHLAPISEPEEEDDPGMLLRQKQRQHLHTQRPLLRVDAFLGEWLNPDYYDLITPPPSSVMMVAGAKADLLRCGDYNGEVAANMEQRIASYPGGYGEVAVDGHSGDEGPLSSLTNLGKALPRRDRASSHGGSSTQAHRSNGHLPKLSTSSHGHDVGVYTPLTPSYAISSSDPIPPGYVAHARDACVDVDYQWDSMREPQNWGHGGEYGEEWGTMHKRCRKAIQQMLEWYRDHDGGHEDHADGAVGQNDGHENSSAETVLILVSHGAACNAIIGGLTDRTVLLDVGMASLTMAVRKEAESLPSIGGLESDGSSAPYRQSSVSIPVSQDYEVKLMASTDHLRASQLHHTASLGSHRRRLDTSSSSLHRSPRSVSPATPNALLTTSPLSASSNGGLWSRSTSGRATLYEPEQEPGDDMVLNFPHSPNIDPKRVEIDASPTVSSSSTVRGDLGRTNSQRGLWGSSAVAEERKEKRKEEKDRDRDGLVPKRRWTVDERSR